jgi:hypothetical protein
MAKEPKRPRNLRDIRRLPPDPWKSDGKMTFRNPILASNAPLGRYKLDEVVSDMFRNGTISSQRTEIEVVRHARGLLDIAGGNAIRYARAHLSTSSRYEDVKSLYENLQIIRDRGRRASNARPEDIAGFIAREEDALGVQDDERDDESYWIAVGTLDELLSELQNLSDKVDQHLRDYPVKFHKPISIEPLTYYFMSFCANFWQSFTGRSLDRSDQGDFRRFLTAGWQDLKFPDPQERNGAVKPLEDHIRERLAKSDIFDCFGP